MYVQRIILGINPRVTKHHAFIFNRATWWQLGLNSKEDICVARSQSLVRDWQGRPLSDSQRSYRSDVVFMRKQVCPAEKDHCGSARGTAGGSGYVTQGAFRLYRFIKGEVYDCVCGS